MTLINEAKTFNFERIAVDKLWNFPQEKELKIHQIHSYPAKFPAFVTTKAIEYANETNTTVKTIADIFCGCGTTAIEAKRNNINYWGCDINPVATLIAKTKSRNYQLGRIEQYYKSITSSIKRRKISNEYEDANDRLKYWYSKENYNELSLLKKIIRNNIPNNSDYQLFFMCGFSNILKPSSYWLTKSIKPHFDPDKKIPSSFSLFNLQYEKMLAAIKELPDLGDSSNKIITYNFLDDTYNLPKADLIVTSPPYVTSYEYADLHQLSSLWLDFTEDYKTLRDGTIGSMYHQQYENEEEVKLNNTANKIVRKLEKGQKEIVRSVSKYFFDIQKTAIKTQKLLNKNGLAFFVIGNTEYKNIKIDNARHLAESLQDANYSEIYVTKRKISNKMLTPYRDKQGRFTSNSKGRKVYHEEYIIVGRK
jgi:methylase of polypeptide subunit release factors